MRRALLILGIFIAPLAVFAAMVAADRTFGGPGRGYGYVVQVKLPGDDARQGLPPVRGPQDASRPLVVIDPGHGGKDPGAGNGALKEKDLVLRLALALRDELLRQGGIRVAMTREDDRYLLLPVRPDIARRLQADLFISIHADSTEVGTGARGATVYVLSDRGSNEAAERIAARENAADEINGIRMADTSNSVGAILVDLSQREMQAKAESFGRLILREGQGRLPFRDEGVQSAAFAVLKAPDVPSILFESGYINNEEDAARLASPAGQQAFAQSLASAVRVHFAREAAPAPLLP
ncbi:MAG: N-acetylmuramoyl-L-alanine amidase [Sphingomonadaceae bacterium]|nr:N-acetylmuramoyl-L-alanine amidase [Sphingomonadaceae bacterium]